MDVLKDKKEHFLVPGLIIFTRLDRSQNVSMLEVGGWGGQGSKPCSVGKNTNTCLFRYASSLNVRIESGPVLSEE